MDSIKSITKENLHHAHMIISNEEILEELFGLIEGFGVSTSANENFIYEKFDKFLIGDARRVFDRHLKKTALDDLQIFVLNFNFITIEAQNALLKMFEEPKERTHFFIIAPSENLFLDTVLSRVSMIKIQDSENINQELGKDFIKMNIGDRIKFVASIVKDIKAEKKTKQDAMDLLSELEVELERVKKFDSLGTVVEARKYLNLNGASVKILLENIALNV